MIVKLQHGMVDFFKTFFRRIRHKGRFLGYIGWVGQGNLGDQAMFEAVKILFPDDTIEIFSGVRKERLLSLVGASGRHKFKSVILGGGTLVNQGYLDVVGTALGSGVRMYTLGTGVGSSGFTAKQDLELEGWRAMLKRFESIGLRGPRSQNSLNEIGVESATVIGDLALALTMESPLLNPGNKQYILNVALPAKGAPDFPSDRLVEYLVEMVDDLSSVGYDPIPVAFCPEDQRAIQRVINTIKQKGVSIEFPKNYDEYCALLEGAEFVVGVRLHSAVLACCAGVPPILIGYRDKCADFMDSMGLMEWHCDAFELKAGDLSDLTKKMISLNRDGLRADIHNRAREWRACLVKQSQEVLRAYNGWQRGVRLGSETTQPRVLACQHGARHRYAIPRMLNRAGMLTAFYTDSSENSLVGKSVKLLGSAAPVALRDFSRWNIQGVPSKKIRSSDGAYLRELMQTILGGKKQGMDMYYQRHQILSAKMKRWGLCESNIVYSMYHEDLEFVRWAKERGALSLIDVFISPLTEQIVEREAVEYPNWIPNADSQSNELEQRLWDETALLADFLICPSEWVAEGVRSVSPDVADRIKVVPYGCSIEYGGQVNEPVTGRILFAGRDPLRKGMHYLAQAATQLAESMPDLDVRIAGEMSPKVVNDPLCKDLNFIGQLDSVQMREEFLSADAMVLPALSEGFAGVVAEAVGAGCPVIVTKEAGSPIVHEREGLIVPSRDVDALTAAIRRMVVDRSFRKKCSEECFRQVPFYSEIAWQKRLVKSIVECFEWKQK